MLKFREREVTAFINVVYKDIEGLTSKELERKYKKQGYFAVPYHYYIDIEGNVNEYRLMSNVGGSDLPASEFGLFILVDTPRKQVMYAEQKEALNDLLDTATLRYPEAEVIEGEL